MATVEVRSVAGKVLRTRELPDAWFGAAVNVSLMHQVVTASAAALRSGTHAVKTRGEVSGGGKKPWRQKGTGRARQGSIRAPQWSGGGVVHGPQPRDHSVRLNKKMRAASLRSALTDAAQSGKLAVVEDLTFETPKTKDAIALLDALDLDGKVLMVLPEPQAETELSFRNLGNVKIDYAPNLGTYDLLFADRVLFTMSALDRLTGETTAEGSTPASATRAVPEETPKAAPAAKPRRRAAKAEDEPADEDQPADDPGAEDETGDEGEDE
jgi:large subunit ribosomal protein L4